MILISPVQVNKRDRQEGLSLPGLSTDVSVSSADSVPSVDSEDSESSE